MTEPFLKDDDGMVVLGVTSGASTPDAAVQESLTNVFMLKKVMDASRTQ